MSALTDPVVWPPIAVILAQVLAPLLAAAVTSTDDLTDNGNRKRSRIATTIAALAALTAGISDGDPITAQTAIGYALTVAGAPTAAYLTFWERFNINERTLPSVTIGKATDTPMGAHGGQ